MLTSKPERTACRIRGAPDPLDPVAHAVSSHRSRSGPVVEIGDGVSQPSSPGKYAFISNSLSPDRTPCSSDSPEPVEDLGSVGRTNSEQLPSSLIQQRFNCTIPLTLQPGRIVDSLLEAPDSSSSVAFYPASVHHSRPGPAARCGLGVFRAATSGKYEHVLVSPLSDAGSISSTVDPANSNPDDDDQLSFLGYPERTVESLMEALNPSDPVLPCAALVHHSRSGPVVGCGERVFQQPDYGEYPCLSESYQSLATVQTTSRTPGDAVTTRKEDMVVYYQNVGGLNTSVEDYRLAVSDGCYDIIVLIETWLDSRTLSSQVFGSDYEVFRCDRNSNNSSKSSGGGVLVAVRSGLKAKAILNDSWTCLEQVWISVKMIDRTLFLCSLYIPPDRVRDTELIETHCQSVFTILDTALPTDDVLVVGDFNLAGISWRPSHSGFLCVDSEHSQLHSGAISILDSYSAATLTQFNHVLNENGRTLDLCFVSTRDQAPYTAVAPCALVKDVPHHPPLIINVENSLVHDFEDAVASVSYDFRRADHRSIAEVLTSIDWEHVLDPGDVETAALTFSNILAYVVDRHVPKRIQSKASRSPWQTSELRKMKTIKRAALRQLTKHRTLALRNHYVRLNHEYQRTSRQCFSRYQRDIQLKFKSHPKSFWKYVNQQRKESGLPATMQLNGVSASTPRDICQLFAEKFASVFNEESLNADEVSIAARNVPPNGQMFSSIHVNDGMISRAASQLKSSNNPGPDGIPSAFLKKHISCLLDPLQRLYRMSLSSGVFPSCWKLAHMYPVHKKGSKRDVDNYRGITSLTAISKLFELIIMEPLLSHCKHVLSPDQHGFTAGRSTSTNLLCLTSHITQSMIERAQTDVIYTDLSAAFDKLNHAIAIAKLDRYGIGGSLLAWFRSYLTDRQLIVTIGDCKSNCFNATSGIPQGSHLGPLIFLLYFNDVNFVIEGPRLSYADDMKIFLRIHSTDDCVFLQQQVTRFANWCSLNRMIVNPTKCSIITFSRKKQPIIFVYSMLGTALERVHHVKDLGVILDSTLTFRQHISYIVEKSSKTLGFIFRIAKNFSDVYCLKSLYCSLVRSTLEYCSTVWSPGYNNGVERIESVQRRFLRFALRRLPWRDPFRLPSYESRCQLIDLDLLRTRRDAARALTIADTLQGRIDCGALLEQIDVNVQPRSLRNSIMLRLPLRRTNYGLHGAFGGLMRVFNRVASFFDFHLTRNALRRSFLSFFSNRNN